MPIIDNARFLELVSEYHKNPEKFIFFIGAGISQPLFPSWGCLLKRFVEEVKQVDNSYDVNELLSCIEKGESFLDVAQACVDVIGHAKYRDIMEKAFDKDFSEESIPQSYKALMSLSPKTIITTNYDRIPEVAGKGVYRIITNKNITEGLRSHLDSKNTVFKIHGDIMDHSSLVLTRDDYQKIIYESSATKHLLTSLLSTKIIVFVGFSLSDPHIDGILDNLKTINAGMPLSHYILLNESSKFKISSFEKRYGVKIISYEPSNLTHPEVVDFLRALECRADDISEQENKKDKIALENMADAVKQVHSSIEDLIPDSAISVFYSGHDIYLSFTAYGETKHEMQKEFLSIIKAMNFECEMLEKIYVFIALKTVPNINFDESQAIPLKAKIKFSDAKKYAQKEISTATVWGLIDFYSVAGLADFFQKDEKIKFSINTGVLGESI